MVSKQFTTLVLFVLSTLAAPSPLVPIRKVNHPLPGRYIVTFKNDDSNSSGVTSITCNVSPDSNVTHQWDIINGFAGAFTDDDLEILRSHPNVVSIEEDGYAHTQATVTQTDATWGLARLSSKTKLANQDATPLTFFYNYDDSAGGNSDVYLIDTGIYTSHSAFGGRASWGAVFGLYRGYAQDDVNGHGTHCAGTAVSSPYGVAKSANIIAVRVLNDGGSGAWSDIISGINWVASNAGSRGRPSVASLSLGGSYLASVNSAVANLVAAGVTTVVAANNGDVDAASFSPSSCPSVITVGATTIDDAKAGYSNYGSVVNIWAPGSEIISTWNNGESMIRSGTSTATPHVAGYAAYLLTLDSSLTPDSVRSTIDSQALKNVLSGIPSGTTNALINNGL